jgi:hypothetical protein
MPRLLVIGVIFTFLGVGCGERSPAPAPENVTPPPPQASEMVAPPDLANVLTELTQALRKFSAEKQKVPASLDELVAAGYIRQVPQAPAGQTFAIDSRNVRVILK